MMIALLTFLNFAQAQEPPCIVDNLTLHAFNYKTEYNDGKCGSSTGYCSGNSGNCAGICRGAMVYFTSKEGKSVAGVCNQDKMYIKEKNGTLIFSASR